jgi:glycine cleavage system H protein
MKKFTKSHEWVELTDGIATIGVTNHAQEQLGDIVYVDLPGAGDNLSKGDTLCSIESVKSANDVYAPISGEVVEANEELDGTPEKINEAAETDGWICKIKVSDEAEMEELLSEEEYEKLIAE